MYLRSHPDAATQLPTAAACSSVNGGSTNTALRSLVMRVEVIGDHIRVLPSGSGPRPAWGICSVTNVACCRLMVSPSAGLLSGSDSARSLDGFGQKVFGRNHIGEAIAQRRGELQDSLQRMVVQRYRVDCSGGVAAHHADALYVGSAAAMRGPLQVCRRGVVCLGGELQ